MLERLGIQDRIEEVCEVNYLQHVSGLLRIAAFAVIALTTPANAQHWSSFRGEDGSGIGTGSPPITWNVETGENIKWKAPIPGMGHSSPIVWGDRVFVTTAIPESGHAAFQTGWLEGTGDSAADDGPWEWRVMCLDKKTGKTIWEQTAHKGVPKRKRHLKASHANCTPATDGKHVVAFFGEEGLFAFDMDGKLLWKKELGTLQSGPVGYPDMQWGFASSPIIHDGKVVVQCDVQNASYWAAYDLENGSEVIRVDRGDDPSWCTPTIHRGKGRTLLICNGYKKMAAYELWSGEQRWHLSGGGDVPVPRPVLAGANIVLTNGHGRKPVYVIDAAATGDLTPADDRKPDGLVWWKQGKGSYMPTPIVVDGWLYVADDSGVMTRFSAATGEQGFRARLPGGGESTYSASPVAADRRIYVTSEDGQVDVVAADSAFKVLASNEMGETCMATPAISDGLLLIRGAKNLYCVGK